MSQLTTLALTGVKNANAVLTFTPALIQPGYAVYENRAGGIMIGYDKLVAAVRRPKKASDRNVRTELRIETPVLKTVDGVTSVARRLSVTISGVCPEDCTLEDRQHINSLVRDAIDEGNLWTPLQESFETPWAA